MLTNCGSRYIFQGLQHFFDGDVEARQIQRHATLHGFTAGFKDSDQALDGVARRRNGVRHAFVYRANRRHACQGFANDAAEERRCCAIGFARPNGDGHQARCTPINIALACEIGQQILEHEFVGAVRRLGRGQCVVCHDVGHGVARVWAKHSHRACKHHARYIAGFAQTL